MEPARKRFPRTAADQLLLRVPQGRSRPDGGRLAGGAVERAHEIREVAEPDFGRDLGDRSGVRREQPRADEVLVLVGRRGAASPVDHREVSVARDGPGDHLPRTRPLDRRRRGRATERAKMPRRRPDAAPAGDPMSLRDRYEQRYASSEKLFARAESVIPGGITHDGRFMRPFPPYIARALGSRKWDVDGREYVDYWMGHGALILGHGHPATVQAIREQAGDGLHYGGNHELEVQWAELICRLVPCAGKVRFTNSGSEAVHLATRLARAFTGKSRS